MTSRILSGFKKHHRVACDSRATLSGVLHYGLHQNLEFTSARMVWTIPFFLPSEDCCEPQARYTLIHIGSTIRRKCIDILLKTFSEIRKRLDDVSLYGLEVPHK